MVAEVWKDIEGFEGVYMVSSYGRVKSLPRPLYNGKGVFESKERIFKVAVSGKGYNEVTLSKNKGCTHKVHRLVCVAFIPNLEGKGEVNHIDGDKLNNRVTNLEWATRSENTQHAYTVLGRGGGFKRGGGNSNSVLTPEAVMDIRENYKPYKTPFRAFAEKYSCSISAVYSAYHGDTW